MHYVYKLVYIYVPSFCVYQYSIYIYVCIYAASSYFIGFIPNAFTFKKIPQNNWSSDIFYFFLAMAITSEF